MNAMSEPQHSNDMSESNAELTASARSAGATQDFVPGSMSTSRAPSPGVHVPGYKMLGVLGRGGMGVVYKAVQEKANRLVALKMILAGAHADHVDQQRFRVEVEAAARLSHPNIVQVHEVGETPDGFPFFSLEFVSGGTLAERLKQGPLLAAEAATLVEALARAMQYAHEYGIIHRDLKPLNILLDSGKPAANSDTMIKDRAARTINSPDRLSTGSSASLSADVSRPLVPKISDFGLAKQLDSEDGLTRTGAIMGSPAYMAPEQAFGQSKHVGPAADIYALGAILYECLTGRPPFKGATVADTLEQVRTMEPISARALAKEIPADLETICLHCLHKDPQRRYGTAEALAEDLRRYREGLAISVRPVGNIERAWRWCNRYPWYAASGAAIFLLLVGITAVSVAAYVEVSAQNVEIETKRKEAEKATDIAKTRQQQSMLALGAAATEIRDLAEEAMVPAERRAKVLAKLIAELQKQVDENAVTDTIDSVRNHSYLYTVLAMAENESANEHEKSTWVHVDNSRSWCDKGMTMVDHWLTLAPDDPLALSRRASLFQVMGSTYSQGFAKGKNLTDAEVLEIRRKKDAYFAKALEIRRKLAGNPEAVKIVDQFTPGKARAELADSLENAGLYEDAFRVHDDLCREQPTPTHLSNRAYAFAKAAYAENDRVKKDVAKIRTYLTKANQQYTEMNERLQRTGQFTRQMLVRWADIINRLARLESDQNRLAEARKHAEKYALMAQRLSTSIEASKHHYGTGWAYYELARMQLAAGENAQARASADACLLRLSLLQADYPREPNTWNLRVSMCRLQLQMGEVGPAIRGADSLKLQVPEVAMADNRFYRLACVYAVCIPAIAKARGKAPLTDDDKKQQAACRDKAFQWLDNAFKHGYPYFDHARKDDPDMAPIRDDPRFEAILTKHEKK